MSDHLTFTQFVSRPAKDVYWAFTNAMGLREWLCDNSFLRLEVGGPLLLIWNGIYDVYCTFTALETDKHLAFTWQGTGEPGVMAVDVTLTPQDDGTAITLVHSKLGEGEVWQKTRTQVHAAWESALHNLKSVMETGLDRRIQDRPMLGIYLGPFDAEIAKRLGVPTENGTLLTGVIEGMGAQAAGLQGDDVIVTLDDQPAGTFNEFNAVIRQHKGGDTIPVEFYRGAQKHRVMMTLTKRPEPNVPAAPAELAERLRATHAQLNAELDAVLAGVPEAILAQPPAPGEWSVNDVLAHLIWSERFLQTLHHGVSGGDDYIAWPDNGVLHLAGILGAYPTGEALLAEFKRQQVQTVAQLVAYPEDLLTSRRGTFVRLVQNLDGWTGHVTVHTAQIRAAIEAAREKAQR